MIYSLENPLTSKRVAWQAGRPRAPQRNLKCFLRSSCAVCPAWASVMVLKQLRSNSTGQRGRQRKQKTGTKFWGRMNTGLYCLIPFLRQLNNKLLLVKCSLLAFNISRIYEGLLLWTALIESSWAHSPSAHLLVWTFLLSFPSKLVK